MYINKANQELQLLAKFIEYKYEQLLARGAAQSNAGIHLNPFNQRYTSPTGTAA